jgi:hypothetical protein
VIRPFAWIPAMVGSMPQVVSELPKKEGQVCRYQLEECGIVRIDILCQREVQ